MAEKQKSTLPLMENIPFYHVEKGGSGARAYRWLYWNVMGRGHYIVASVTCYRRSDNEKLECFEWAAYLGSSPEGAERERDGFMRVARHGAKFHESIARAAFPIFKEIPYRG